METAPFTPSKVICSAGINPWPGISCALDFGKKHYFRHGITPRPTFAVIRAAHRRRLRATEDSAPRSRSAETKSRGYKGAHDRSQVFSYFEFLCVRKVIVNGMLRKKPMQNFASNMVPTGVDKEQTSAAHASAPPD